MENDYTDEFIKMTAKDYDVTFEVAKKIIKEHPNNFYQELEIHIMNRNKDN